MTDSSPSSSPHWGLAPKLIIGLSFVAILGWFLIEFRNLFGPLILVFLLVYIIYPVAKRITAWIKIPWRLAVTLIYLVLVILVIGLLTLGGLALVNQLQSLIIFLQNALTTLPLFLQNLAKTSIAIGPFQFSFSQINITSVTSQILSSVQPLLGRIGSVLGFVASGAASTIGWLVFILIVSYFILVESAGLSAGLIHVHIPGYDEDIQRLGDEISGIWNSFLRGQLIIISIVFVVYSILLGSFGLPFYLGLALIAGLARFIPYVGAFIMWTTIGLVTYFKGSYPFGLPPWGFVILVVGVCMLVDSIMDNYVAPHIMGQTLKVHPAAVLISALIMINVIGLVGVVVAAPILATLKLFSGYAFRKLLDQDPWEGVELRSVQKPPPIYKEIQKIALYLFKKIRRFWIEAYGWLCKKFIKVRP